MKHTVFISHSSKDKAIGEEVCRFLEKNGIPCWIAPRDVTPGKNYGAAIVDAIDECRIFVLILSGQSNTSGQVVREVERAASSNSVIIPLRVEDVQPSRDLEFYVSSSHWLDAIGKPHSKHLGHLLEAIRNWEPAGEAERPSAATAIPAPPPVRSSNRQLIIGGCIGGVVLIVATIVYFILRHPSSSPSTITAQTNAIASPTISPGSTSPAAEIASASPAVEAPAPTVQSSPTKTLHPGAAVNPVSTPVASASMSPTAAPPGPPRLRPGAPVASPAPATTPVIRQVTASSVLASENYEGKQRHHGARLAADGDITTAWVGSGKGPGEWLKISFQAPTVITSVSIYGGYGVDSGRYYKNNRVSKIRIIFSNGNSRVLSLADKMEFQRFELPAHPTIEWFRFEIVSVYRGTDYDSTPISEIAFNRDAN